MRSRLIMSAAVLAAAAMMIYQLVLIRERVPDKCFAAFLNNRHIGAVVFAGIFLDYALV